METDDSAAEQDLVDDAHLLPQDVLTEDVLDGSEHDALDMIEPPLLALARAQLEEIVETEAEATVVTAEVILEVFEETEQVAPAKPQQAFVDLGYPRDEVEAIVRAAASVGRLDEYMRTSRTAPIVRAWFLRTEALAIARSENLASDETRLSFLINEINADEITGKADWTAYDIHHGLAMTQNWLDAIPSDLEVREAWKATDESNLRVSTPKLEWQLDQDAAEISELVRNAMATPDPWGAAEAIRRLLVKPKLMEGQGRRMAMLIAPSLIRAAFGAPNVALGIADELWADPEATSEASIDQSSFNSLFFGAVGHSAQRTYEAAVKQQRLANEMNAACPKSRSTSSIEKAIAQMLATPVTTVPRLAQHLGISSVGASAILERLVEANYVKSYGEPRIKGRIFSCPKALSL